MVGMTEWPAPLDQPQNRLVVEGIVKKLGRAYKKKFPSYLDWEDVQQECWLYVLEGIKLFDESKSSLTTFLYLYLTTRLNMLRREFYGRKVECEKCCGTDVNCRKCSGQRERSAARRSLYNPEGLPFQHKTTDDEIVLDEVVLREFEELLHCKLPPLIRGEFLRMRDGAKVSTAKREKVREFLRGFIDGGETE